jgi:hypothetical protein
VPLKLIISVCIGTKSLQTLNEISRKLCIQSKEFREILMSKMGNFYFENGSTDSNMADIDCALALSLQDEFSALDNEETRNSGDKRKRPTSIVDDYWETIDPNA